MMWRHNVLEQQVITLLDIGPFPGSRPVCILNIQCGVVDEEANPFNGPSALVVNNQS